MSDDIFNIDINDLTIAEVVEIEERTGLPLDALGQADKPKARCSKHSPTS